MTDVDVRLERWGDGGFCVGRVDGRVIFCRLGAPGELARVRVVDDSNDRFWFGEVIDVLADPHPARVEARCAIYGPGGCGGCDLQHLTAAYQREAKTAVLAETLQRIGGLSWDGQVEPLEPRWGWRTRNRYVADADGRPAMRRWRSREAVALPAHGCAIATPEAQPGGPRADGTSARTQTVGPRTFEVPAGAFWQVHPAAAEALVDVVVEAAEVQTGQVAWDVFCGVGLFAGALVDAGACVWGTDGNKAALRAARRNVPQAQFLGGDVGRAIAHAPDPDVVVIDPPRTGSGRTIWRGIAERRPGRIIHVSCHPANLASHLSAAPEIGYRLASLRAFDAFPQTHHVEAVAVLERA